MCNDRKPASFRLNQTAFVLDTRHSRPFVVFQTRQSAMRSDQFIGRVRAREPSLMQCCTGPNPDSGTNGRVGPCLYQPCSRIFAIATPSRKHRATTPRALWRVRHLHRSVVLDLAWLQHNRETPVGNPGSAWFVPAHVCRPITLDAGDSRLRINGNKPLDFRRSHWSAFASPFVLRRLPTHLSRS
jgi:hypothetical protein